VQVSSEARGGLVQTAGARIPNAITVDGMPVNLSAPSMLEIPLADSVRGQTMPVQVTVGDFENAPVGHYRDVVTFRISAK
jgi:hypothetical protein